MCAYGRRGTLSATPVRMSHPIDPSQAIARAAAVLTLVLPATVAAQPLPEGDTGIASQYQSDEDIGGDPAVLLHEDFESIGAGTLTSDNSAFDSVYGDNVITQNPADVNAGTQAVERTHASPGSFGAVKFVGPGFDTLHIRYYLKYHAQFPGAHHTGGGAYAAAGATYTQIGDITGVTPNGSNHFQAWLDDMAPFFNWTPAGNDAPPGWLHFYCYNMDQASQWGDLLFPDGMVIPGASGVNFGNGFVPRPNVNPARDQWASYEVMLQANTPGMSDGRIAFWVDGQLAGDFPNLQLRSTNNLQPNHVALSTYSSQVHPDKTIWYDDVVAATSYIGPMFGGSGTGGGGNGAGGQAAGGTDGGPGGNNSTGEGGDDRNGGAAGPTRDDAGGADSGCHMAVGTPASPLIPAWVLLAAFCLARRRHS